MKATELFGPFVIIGLVAVASVFAYKTEAAKPPVGEWRLYTGTIGYHVLIIDPSGRAKMESHIPVGAPPLVGFGAASRSGNSVTVELNAIFTPKDKLEPKAVHAFSMIKPADLSENGEHWIKQ